MLLQADCLVLPSRYDGWGAVVSEALMAGTPVICSDRCGAVEVVYASKVGGVFPADNLDALIDMLARQYALGVQTTASRKGLAEWARCLGANAGALYLAQLLDYPSGSGNRLCPPWQ